MMIDEPKAWIKKYFKAASEEYWLFLEEMSGIKDKRFSSSPIQAPNQEEDEMERRVPNIRVEKNKIWEEESEKKRKKEQKEPRKKEKWTEKKTEREKNYQTDNEVYLFVL